MKRLRAALQTIRAELRSVRTDYRVAFGAGPRPWYAWAEPVVVTVFVILGAPNVILLAVASCWGCRR
jgi:hypothetical protein